MVIGFDGSRAFTSKRTGTENYSYQLLKALAKIDRKNSYIVYLRSKGDALQGWPKNFKFQILNFKFLWTQGGLAVQTFKDNLDVLFVPAHTLPLIRKPGLKTVITVHDLGSEYLPQMHQLKQRLYLGLMQRFQLKTASKLIAVSKATKEDLIKKVGLDPKKIEVIYEGFDPNLFKPVKDDALVNSLRYYNLQPKTYYLFVGTVQPRKNLERLILAFHKLIKEKPINEEVLRGKAKQSKISHNTKYMIHNTDFQLVIAGNRGWLSDEIYALPKKLGIEDSVKFLGYVPDEDMPALYKGAIALTFPSLFEGFGLPILEAQACGCPVITSNISSMPEVGGQGAIYVNPNDMDDIVKGMIKVQSVKFKVQSSVKAGYENIKRFSWEKCALQTLNVLEQVYSI